MTEGEGVWKPRILYDVICERSQRESNYWKKFFLKVTCLITWLKAIFRLYFHGTVFTLLNIASAIADLARPFDEVASFNYDLRASCSMKYLICNTHPKCRVIKYWPFQCQIYHPTILKANFKCMILKIRLREFLSDVVGRFEVTLGRWRSEQRRCGRFTKNSARNEDIFWILQMSAFASNLIPLMTNPSLPCVDVLYGWLLKKTSHST